MEEALLKLFYDYSVNGKLADNEFVEKLAEIIISHKRLDAYVNNLTIYSTPVDIKNGKYKVANYSFVEKNIGINLDALNYSVQGANFEYKDVFNGTEQIFLDNAIVAHCIMHELEHADQNKRYHSSLTDIETNLIKLGIKPFYLFEDINNLFRLYLDNGFDTNEVLEYMHIHLELSKKYSAYNPIERLAQIKTYKTLTDVVATLKDKFPNLYEFELGNFVNNLIYGYESNEDGLMAPTLKYIQGMNYHDELQKLDFYDDDPTIATMNIFQNYPLIKRLSLGLSVTSREHEGIQKVLHINNKL